MVISRVATSDPSFTSCSQALKRNSSLPALLFNSADWGTAVQFSTPPLDKGGPRLHSSTETVPGKLSGLAEWLNRTKWLA
ncbi:hypothetical protein CBR_g50404 [Chara braunii]|uniref:Uncharacterized protein n=1 Tax=Chara braunii TaxID=69332 RepID=A0A388M6U6_CHABU|nr:hypothetical protein CBR_g50404 [Chara braunii]|eukprot:GBG90225.1 hypothetical protein CBR_g50404 [Chara braunii]